MHAAEGALAEVAKERELDMRRQRKARKRASENDFLVSNNGDGDQSYGNKNAIEATEDELLLSSAMERVGVMLEFIDLTWEDIEARNKQIDQIYKAAEDV